MQYTSFQCEFTWNSQKTSIPNVPEEYSFVVNIIILSIELFILKVWLHIAPINYFALFSCEYVNTCKIVCLTLSQFQIFKLTYVYLIIILTDRQTNV